MSFADSEAAIAVAIAASFFAGYGSPSAAPVGRGGRAVIIAAPAE